MDVYQTVANFYESYSGKKRVIASSVLGRKIYAMLLGREEEPLGLMQAAIHAREYITAYLALGMIQNGLKRGGVWVVPLSNPDGALLSETGLSSAPESAREELVRLNGGKRDFSLWKANAEGVDLNVNFDAGWGEGAQNVFVAGSENYVGARPFSAPESRALKEFTLSVRPAFTLSLHTKGEVIYWRFRQPPLRAARDKRLAKILAESVNCPLGESPNSAGGYKDWCVQALKIPAFTLEAGSEKLRHPIGKEHLKELLLRYGGALDALTGALAK